MKWHETMYIPNYTSFYIIRILPNSGVGVEFEWENFSFDKSSVSFCSKAKNTLLFSIYLFILIL